MTVRFTTYNLLNLFGAETAGARQHYETIAGVIRTLDADVLAVQEILAPDAAAAAERLRRLADDAGMRCEVPGSAGSAGSSTVGGLRLGATTSSSTSASFSRAASASRWRFHMLA